MSACRATSTSQVLLQLSAPESFSLGAARGGEASVRTFLFRATADHSYYIQQRVQGTLAGESSAALYLFNPWTLQVVAMETSGWLLWRCPQSGLWVLRVEWDGDYAIDCELSIAQQQNDAISRDSCGIGRTVLILSEAWRTVAATTGYLPETCEWMLTCRDPDTRVRALLTEYSSSVGAIVMTVTDVQAQFVLAELTGQPYRLGTPGTFVASGNSLHFALRFGSEHMKSVGLTGAIFRAFVSCVPSESTHSDVAAVPDYAPYVWSLTDTTATAQQQPQMRQPIALQLDATTILSEPVSIGFNFPFGGSDFSSFRLSRFGLIVFGEPPNDLQHHCCETLLPVSLYGAQFIAPLWLSWATPGEVVGAGFASIHISYDDFSTTTVHYMMAPSQNSTMTVCTQISLRSNGQFEVEIVSTEGIDTTAGYVIGWQTGYSAGEQTCRAPDRMLESPRPGPSCAVAGTRYTFVPRRNTVTKPAYDPCRQQSAKLGSAVSLNRWSTILFDPSDISSFPMCHWRLFCPFMSVVRLRFRWINASVDGDFLQVTDPNAFGNTEIAQLTALSSLTQPNLNYSSTTNVVHLRWSGLGSYFSPSQYRSGFELFFSCSAHRREHHEILVDGPSVEVKHSFLTQSWLYFIAGTDMYEIASSDGSSNAIDTVIYLIDSRDHVIGMNDDVAAGLSSLIAWTSTRSEAVQVMVQSMPRLDAGDASISVATTSTDACTWTIQRGIKYLTEVIGILSFATLEHCQQTCLQRMGCIAISYPEAQSLCWLHSINGEASEVPPSSGHRRTQNKLEDRGIWSSIPSEVDPEWNVFVYGATLPPAGGHFVTALGINEHHCRWFISRPYELPQADKPWIRDLLVQPAQGVGGSRSIATTILDLSKNRSVLQLEGKHPPPGIVNEPGNPTAVNCSTPMESFTAGLPGTISGNIRCTNKTMLYGTCDNDRLLGVASVEQCASSCLALNECQSFEYSSDESSTSFQICSMNNKKMNDPSAVYEAIRSIGGVRDLIKFYEKTFERCVVRRILPTEYSASEQLISILQLDVVQGTAEDYVSQTQTPSKISFSYGSKAQCAPLSLCYGQLPCNCNAGKALCSCPDAFDGASSCHELMGLMDASTGSHTILTDGKTETVYCDMDSEGGGWTLLGASDSQELQAGSFRWVSQGLRERFPGSTDIRLKCTNSRTASNVDVDLIFYDSMLYSCFSGVDNRSPPQQILDRKNVINGVRQRYKADVSEGCADFLARIESKGDEITSWGRNADSGKVYCAGDAGVGSNFSVWFKENFRQYTFRRVDFPVGDWIDAARVGISAEIIAGRVLSDDDAFEIPLPFEFSYFNRLVTAMNVSTNG